MHKSLCSVESTLNMMEFSVLLLFNLISLLQMQVALKKDISLQQSKKSLFNYICQVINMHQYLLSNKTKTLITNVTFS